MTPIRVVDSGLRPARWNVAMSAALLESHRTGRVADTLRFHHYPRSVLIGRHQDFDREVHAGRRLRKQLEFARRITGGGAVYMSPGILAWEIVTDRVSVAATPALAAERICTGIASGLARFGLPARYRPLNDVEIDGRKVCGSSGSFEGPTLVYQGTILIDFNFVEMAKALVSSEDVDGRMSLRKRVASLTDFLGRVPDLKEIHGVIVAGLSHVLGRTMTPAIHDVDEWELAERILSDEIGTDDFVFGGKLPEGVRLMPRRVKVKAKKALMP